jgi:CRISPR/Cas system-associated protein endoribonuclease Cas2
MMQNSSSNKLTSNDDSPDLPEDFVEGQDLDRRWGHKTRKKIAAKKASREEAEKGMDYVPLYLQFEKKIYKEFRKILFKEGIWPQEFLKFAISSLAFNNDNANRLLKDLKEHKAVDILKGGKNTKVLKINVENIYDMIELEFNKTHFGVTGSVENNIQDSAYKKT